MPPKPQNNNFVLDIQKIMGMLPHRYPFLLIDRVLQLEKGESIVAIKNVTVNESFFQGHFPSYKVMPGVLIAEALAQAGGVLLYYSIPDPSKKLVFLSKIMDTRFRRPVVPGDQLILKVQLLKMKKKFCHIKGIAYVDDEVVAESEAMASLIDIEELNGNQ